MWAQPDLLLSEMLCHLVEMIFEIVLEPILLEVVDDMINLLQDPDMSKVFLHHRLMMTGQDDLQTIVQEGILENIPRYPALTEVRGRWTAPAKGDLAIRVEIHLPFLDRLLAVRNTTIAHQCLIPVTDDLTLSSRLTKLLQAHAGHGVAAQLEVGLFRLLMPHPDLCPKDLTADLVAAMPWSAISQLDLSDMYQQDHHLAEVDADMNLTGHLRITCHHRLLPAQCIIKIAT